MYTVYMIIWVLISLIILFLTTRAGLKHKKNIYRIVGWNLLSFLVIPIIIQLVVLKIYLWEAKSEYEKAKIGETMTVKGLLDFHITFLASGDSLIYILTPDSVNGNKIIRSDSTHFSITIPYKKNMSGAVGTCMHISADKVELRKFQGIDILELQKKKQEIEITFLGKKTDDDMWNCINILSIEKINSGHFPVNL